MPSRSRNLDFIFVLPPWAGSVVLHSILLLGVAAVFKVGEVARESVTQDMVIYEAPTVGAKPSTIVPVARPQAKAAENKRAVFGANRKSLTADDGLDVKAGNTIAKEADDKVLKESDPDELPIPVDEYVVSQMPQLINEVRVAYPPDAKKNGIQGAVVMDILVDIKGVVRDAVLVQGPGFGLNEAALSAVRRFQFQPARVEQKPVAVRIRYSYRFVLEK